MFLNRFPTLVGTFIVSKFLGLLDRGWDVHVICNRSELTQWELFSQLQPRSELQSRVHATPDRDAVLKTLMVLKPDIIHFEHGFSALGRMYLKEVLGCKVVVSFRGSDLKVYRLEDPNCYKEVWDGADALHLCGQHLWEYAQRRGCPSDKFHVVIPGGIDAVFFDHMERRHPDMVGILERPIRILSVGRLHWVKGYEYALEAVKLLVNQGIQCEYRIIGDGDHQPAVIFTILDLKLDNVVHMLGGRPSSEVKGNMYWADVFLHAAVSEGFCIAVLEAQAMALPIVCTDAGGLPEGVVDMETGFIVPRRDPQALAEKLLMLSKRAELRQRMGETGRRWVETNFRMEDEISRFERLYRQVLALPPEPQTRTSEISGSQVRNRQIWEN